MVTLKHFSVGGSSVSRVSFGPFPPGTRITGLSFVAVPGGGAGSFELSIAETGGRDTDAEFVSPVNSAIDGVASSTVATIDVVHAQMSGEYRLPLDLVLSQGRFLGVRLEDTLAGGFSGVLGVHVEGRGD